MTNHCWHTIVCIDCNATIAYSFDPIQLPTTVEFRCYLCAHVHAQVATWMMPIGNGLSTNSLYGVCKTGDMQILREQFERFWKKLYAKLENHRVAKAYKKAHDSK